MKVARLVVTTVEVHCPYCDELSYGWVEGDWEVSSLKHREVMTCRACDKSFKVPSRIAAVTLRG